MSDGASPVESPLTERLRVLDTSSLCDAAKGSRALRVLPRSIRPVTPGVRLVGRAVTADARGDLMAVIGALQLAGPGDVLVVAAGSEEHAVAGELFATEALRRGLSGLVVDGLVRDSATLAGLGLPVFARGVVPTACPALAVPVVQTPVLLGDVEVRPGDLVVGDDDGVVVSDPSAFAAVISAAEAIQQREDGLRAAMAVGRSLFDALNFDEHAADLRAGRPSALTFR